MPRPKQTQFQFVNIDNPEQSGHIETRRLVRRHVMQHHLEKRLQDQRREKLASNDAPSADSVAQNSPAASIMCDCFGSFEKTIASSKINGSLLVVAQCPTCGRLFLKSADSDTQAIVTPPQSPAKEISRLGSGRTDPFASYAIEMSPYMHGLLDHMVVTMTPAISPVDTKYGSRTHLNKSFNFMISDPAVLHSSLAVASMHFDFCRGHRRLAYYTAFHRGEAIRLVNEMLQDENRAISDEMVACVVRLSTFESFSGDHKGWRAHADALVEIVRRRGGLQRLGYVKRQCYESDIMGAMVGGTRPLFRPVPEIDLVPLPVFPIDERTLDSTTVTVLDGTGFANIIANPLLAQTLRDMRGLLTDLSTIEDSRVFSPHMLLFTTKRTFIEYPLLSLPYAHVGVSPLENSVRLAALIFSNRVFRNHPASSGVHVSLLMQLQASLSFFDPMPSRVMLWITVTAGCVTTDEHPAIRSWFGLLLRSVRAGLGINTWRECKDVLGTFLWHGGRLDDAALAFWIVEST